MYFTARDSPEDVRVPKLDVLVVGATGRQGGAVARALLQGGHHVRALTRNLGHPAADVLRLRGARLAWADLDDAKRLDDAAAGADAVFAITTPFENGPDTETRHGLALVEMARRLDIPHLVYSSAIGAAEFTGVPEFDGKHEVEQFLRASGVPHTILCPAFFMENLLTGRWLEHLGRGELSLPLSEGHKLQLAARADVGRFTRIVLERRDEFLGRRVCVASDEQTPIEMAATLARIIGQRVQYVRPDADTLRSEDPAAAAKFEWLDRNEGGADVVALRSLYPEVNWHTLDGWAKRQDWSILPAPR